MENIKVLRQRKVDLKRKAEAIIHAAEQAGVQFTSAQQTELDAIQAQLQKTNVDVAAVEAEMDRERNAPWTGNAYSGGGEGIRWANVTPATGAKYSQMFPHEPRSTNGFGSREEFLSILASQRFDPRLYPSGMYGAAANESVPSEGGFSVPTEYAAQLLDESLETEIIRPRATVWPMTSATKKIPGWDGLDQSGGSLAGFTAQWMNELATNTPQVGKLKLLELHAQKLALFASASNELLADGMSFEQQLNLKMVQAVGWGMDVAFIRGTGAGQPLGILNAPALITVAKESSQSTATIITQNVVSMYARMYPGCVDGAIWICNQDTVPQLLQLTLGTGTAVTRLLEKDPDTGGWSMLTRPVIFTNKTPTLGSVGDIIFCDPRQYAIGLRKEISMDKSQHLGFLEDSSAFRVIVRCDGEPMWEKVFTPKTGNGSTLSPFVTLAVRP